VAPLQASPVSVRGRELRQEQRTRLAQLRRGHSSRGGCIDCPIHQPCSQRRHPRHPAGTHHTARVRRL